MMPRKVLEGDSGYIMLSGKELKAAPFVASPLLLPK